jgi:hypothetical protein
VAGDEVRIEGLPELHRSLDGLAGDLRDLSPVNGEVAAELVKAIGAAAPRLTGRLAASFTGTGTSNKAEVSSDLDYAGPQNYGVPAHNIEATHYAENALASSSGAIEAKYQGGVQKLLRKAEA